MPQLHPSALLMSGPGLSESAPLLLRGLSCRLTFYISLGKLFPTFGGNLGPLAPLKAYVLVFSAWILDSHAKLNFSLLAETLIQPITYQIRQILVVRCLCYR
jgi:hypothetical protein